MSEFQRTFGLQDASTNQRLGGLFTNAALRAPFSTEGSWSVSMSWAEIEAACAGLPWATVGERFEVSAPGNEGVLLTYIVEGAECAVWLRLIFGTLHAGVCGPSREVAVSVLAALREACPETDPTLSSAVWMTFWYYGPHGPERRKRRIIVPSWEEIARNYPALARQPLDLLTTVERPVASGQFLFWHGPPGTGKTYALRALTWAWREWCSFHYITDPDQFFGDHANYLMQVLLDEEEPERAGRPLPWRLLILEDAGEFLTVDAREWGRAGRGFARFLNTVDGLLGQGLQILLLITSNEDLGKLHPAAVRPGRCAMKVEFLPFGRMEAAAWLMGNGEGPAQRSVSSSMTLAELYASTDGRGLTDGDGGGIGFAPSLVGAKESA